MAVTRYSLSFVGDNGHGWPDKVEATVITDDPDSTGELLTFLHAIDPVELERVALLRDDLDATPGGLTSAMLRQLQEWGGGG